MTIAIQLEGGSTVRITGHFAEMIVGLLPSVQQINAIEYGEVKLNVKPGKAVPAFTNFGKPIVLG